MAPKRRDAVGYTLPGQDDTISQDNTNIDQGSTQARRESELRIRGAGVRHGAVGENGLPSGSSSTAPQGHSQPVTLDVATTSSSSYVPKPSQDQTQTQVRGPSLDHGPDGLYHEQVHKFKIGTPQLAAFINSSDHNAIHRRFGLLAARVLLHREIDLTRLETKLNKMDEDDALDSTMIKRLRGNIFDEDDGVQEALLEDIESKLSKYYDLLLHDMHVRALGQAPTTHHEQLLSWMHNVQPLDDGPNNFIFHVDDFVSVARQSQRGAHIPELLESLLRRFPILTRLGKRLLQSQKDRERIDDPHVDQYSPRRIGIFNRFLAVFLAICVLLIPVMLLFLRNMSKEAMAWLVFAFVFFFCVMVTVLTEAKVLEIFVATAAYTAVLVTFLGNLAHG